MDLGLTVSLKGRGSRNTLTPALSLDGRGSRTALTPALSLDGRGRIAITGRGERA